MSDQKIENYILWILVIILTTVLITVIMIMNISIVPSIRLQTFDLTAIAALFTATVTLFTLFEIQKQRKKMYEPAFAFKRGENLFNSESLESHLNIEIYNIGFGTAANLKVQWEYYDKLKDLRKVFPDFENDFIELTNPLNKKLSIYFNKAIDSKKEIDFLLPISVSNEPTHINIPTILTYYVLKKWSEVFNERKNGNKKLVFEDYDIPFTLTYNDINTSRCSKKYILRLGLIAWIEDQKEVRFSMEVLEI